MQKAHLSWAILLIPALLLVTCGQGTAADLPASPPATLEDLAPHASGICLAEVVDITERDDRPCDGNLCDLVKLKILRQSGLVNNAISVVKEHGGLCPPGVVPSKISEPLMPGDLKQGKRYWLAFGSACPTGLYVTVIKFWPEDTPAVAARLDQAVKNDLFAWKPQYDSQTGLTCGHRIDDDKKWQLRVEKDGKVLWEKTVLGTMAHRSCSWGLWTGGRSEGFPAKMPACGKIMIAESAMPLEAENEFDLPAKTYYVCSGYDPETGQRLAVWISRCQDGLVDLVYRDYDPKTGTLRREARFDFPESGGLKAGAKTDAWYRKIVRTFDPASGKMAREEVFRHDQDADPAHRWVKIGP